MTSLYVESLLLEVHLEDSNDLKQEMKSRWPKLDVIEPPPGAELADPNQTTNPKDKRKRPDTVKVTKTGKIKKKKRKILKKSVFHQKRF